MIEKGKFHHKAELRPISPFSYVGQGHKEHEGTDRRRNVLA
jgi:hypothetical protein